MAEKNLSRVLAVCVLTAASITMGASIASAAPPPPDPTPLQCIDEFTFNDNYVGDGWVGALVTTASGAVGEFSLFCGDELSGVVHTGHPLSSGTVHPIFEDTQDYYQKCWELTIEDGVVQDIPSDPGRKRIVRTNALGLTSTAFVDVRGFAYTLFTSEGNSDVSNDWLKCVTFI